MSYTVAWIVAAAAAVIGSVALYMLTRPVQNALVRHLLCLLPPVLLLVPAPVPHFGGYFAPAFVVAIFESVFVEDGRPRAALVILAVAGCGAALAMLLVNRALGGGAGRQEVAADTEDN